MKMGLQCIKYLVKMPRHNAIAGVGRKTLTTFLQIYTNKLNTLSLHAACHATHKL